MDSYRLINLVALYTRPVISPLWRALNVHRFVTRGLRVLPDFLIIGAQRCGTTSLYRYLAKHPCVAPSFTKEVHFFDNDFVRGEGWYRAHFPTALSAYYSQRIRRCPFVTGEASPYYIYHPHAAKRVAAAIPKVKLVALLRNPVDRAYSHYHHEVRGKAETLTFEEAIERETDRLSPDIERMSHDEHYMGYNHNHFSYLSRGIYVDQLKTWLQFFAPEQMLILRSEDFYRQPAEILGRVLDFLRLPGWEPRNYKRHNPGRYPRMDTETRRRLAEYFKPYNRELYNLLGTDFEWDA
jgi:hypothetical protein